MAAVKPMHELEDTFYEEFDRPEVRSLIVGFGGIDPSRKGGGGMGAQGPKGDPGPQGEPGPKGATGPQGPQGPKGDKGDTGAQGPQGEVGPKGDKGDTGPQGEQGPKGDKGADGVMTFEDLTPEQKASLKGDKGETGEQGPKGDKGDTGEQGPQGEAGPTSFPYRGTWATGRTYNGLDVVQYGNQLYMALYGNTSTSANAPGATGTAWTQLTFDAAFSATKDEIAAVANAGAKNILPVKFPTPTVTVDGVTYSINDSGSIVASGKNTSTSGNSGPVFAQIKVPAGKYILSGNKLQSDGVFRVGKMPGSTYVSSGADNLLLNLPDGGEYSFAYYTAAGKTFSNSVLCQPMLRNANITDDTYVPYGMTNAELSQDTGYLIEESAILSPIFYRKVGKIVYLSFNNVSPTETLKAGNNELFTLPQEFRPTMSLSSLGYMIKNSSLMPLSVTIYSSGLIVITPLMSGIDSTVSMSCCISYPV